MIPSLALEIGGFEASSTGTSAEEHWRRGGRGSMQRNTKKRTSLQRGRGRGRGRGDHGNQTESASFRVHEHRLGCHYTARLP